jgi:hypothetical protein
MFLRAFVASAVLGALVGLVILVAAGADFLSAAFITAASAGPASLGVAALAGRLARIGAQAQPPWRTVSRTFVLLLFVTLTASCAARANLDALDARTQSGRAVWAYYRGTVCDFRAHGTVCVSGVDEGRRLDVTSTITEVLASELPSFKNTCDHSNRRIRVEYTANYSHCTHCPPPSMSTRFAVAFVRVEAPNGWEADATWSDTHGGSAQEVAQRFGHALAVMLHQATSPACETPPNTRLEPAAASAGGTVQHALGRGSIAGR